MVLFQVQSFRTGTRSGLKHLHQSGKTVKTKSNKVLVANSYVVEVAVEMLVEGLFGSPILNRVIVDIVAIFSVYLTMALFENTNNST